MPFDQRTAAQMAAYFLRQANGPMPVLKLMKLMYLADRKSLQMHGHPITYDAMVSMPHGPVLSMTLNLANGAYEPEHDGWDSWVRDRQGYNVELQHDFSRDDLLDLSDADIDVLDLTWREFGHMNKWQIRDYTHDECAEWRDPHGSSLPISYDEVFKALGRTDDEALQLATQIRDAEQIHWKIA